MNDKFINTSDEKTATLLRSMGFTELPKSGNLWVFVNDSKIQFSSKDVKLVYTNVLTF